MNAIFSQIDKKNFDADARRELAGVDSTPRVNGKAAAQNFLTRLGGATLADFVVAFTQDMVYPFAHKPRNQMQGRRLQLNKILHS